MGVIWAIIWALIEHNKGVISSLFHQDFGLPSQREAQNNAPQILSRAPQLLAMRIQALAPGRILSRHARLCIRARDIRVNYVNPHYYAGLQGPLSIRPAFKPGYINRTPWAFGPRSPDTLYHNGIFIDKINPP